MIKVYVENKDIVNVTNNDKETEYLIIDVVE